MLTETKYLEKYMIIDIDKNVDSDHRRKKTQKSKKNVHHVSDDYLLADVTLGKLKTDGSLHENLIYTQTHLGKILHAGDTVLCYDMLQCPEDEAVEYQKNNCNKYFHFFMLIFIFKDFLLFRKKKLTSAQSGRVLNVNGKFSLNLKLRKKESISRNLT